MKKPWIGIPTRYHQRTEYFGQIRHYLEAVIAAGGLPLMIPLVDDAALIAEYAVRIDGVLLPGSPTDIEPHRYGAAPHERLGELCPERDVTDFALLEHAERAGKPVLGICFGAQSLNVYRGGTLVQDIPSQVPHALVHDLDDGEDTPPEPARHPVRMEAGTLLSRLAGGTAAVVNSYHHQSVERPGAGLRPVAISPDGVVEAVEDVNGRFVLGVQWHPERGWRDDAVSQALFRAFVGEAARIIGKP